MISSLVTDLQQFTASFGDKRNEEQSFMGWHSPMNRKQLSGRLMVIVRRTKNTIHGLENLFNTMVEDENPLGLYSIVVHPNN